MPEFNSAGHTLIFKDMPTTLISQLAEGLSSEEALSLFSFLRQGSLVFCPYFEWVGLWVFNGDIDWAYFRETGKYRPVEPFSIQTLRG